MYTIYYAVVDSEALKLYLNGCGSEFLCLYVYLEQSRTHVNTILHPLPYIPIDMECARRPMDAYNTAAHAFDVYGR